MLTRRTALLRTGTLLLALVSGATLARAQVPPPGSAPPPGAMPPPGGAAALAIPAPQAEVVPPPPRGHWVWQPGHWRWTGVRYVWVPGRYVHPHPRQARWIEGRWVWRGRGWVWVPGHWS
jgi:WXXGXW repeat (2 copies)